MTAVLDLNSIELLALLDDAALGDIASAEGVECSAPFGCELTGLSAPAFRERLDRLHGHTAHTHRRITLKEIGEMRRAPVTGKDLRQIIERLSNPPPKRVYHRRFTEAERGDY
jgi:hypothetical protein